MIKWSHVYDYASDSWNDDKKELQEEFGRESSEDEDSEDEDSEDSEHYYDTVREYESVKKSLGSL